MVQILPHIVMHETATMHITIIVTIIIAHFFFQIIMKVLCLLSLPCPLLKGYCGAWNLHERTTS